MTTIKLKKYPDISLDMDERNQKNLQALADLFEAIIKKMEFRFKSSPMLPLKISVDPNANNPVCYTHQHKIVLSVTNSLYRAQAAYQFSHEFCHWLISSPSDTSNLKWLEEALCETASRHILHELPHINLRNRLLQSATDKTAFRNYSSISRGAAAKPWNLNCAYIDSDNSVGLRDSLRKESRSKLRPHIWYLGDQLLPIFEHQKDRWQDVILAKGLNDELSLASNLQALSQQGKTDCWRKISILFSVPTT